jgi:hypothetical protein
LLLRRKTFLVLVLASRARLYQSNDWMGRHKIQESRFKSAGEEVYVWVRLWRIIMDVRCRPVVSLLLEYLAERLLLLLNLGLSLTSYLWTQHLLKRQQLQLQNYPRFHPLQQRVRYFCFLNKVLSSSSPSLLGQVPRLPGNDLR